MNPTPDSFEITPRIVPADTECEVVIRPRFPHAAFVEGYDWHVMAVSREDVIDRTSYQTVGTRPPVRIQDGAMVFRYHFRGEQEHRFWVQGGKGEHTIVRADANVFSLRADLMARRPFRGDLHLHTTDSDGKCSPAYVAARCRDIGMDFFAITDHYTMAGSREAVAAFADAPVDVRICLGEEVHPPGNWVHMVHFGGSDSVNDMIGSDVDAYRRAVAEIEKTLPDLQGLARHQYASCRWCYEKIRSVGGAAILAHPYWNFWHGFSVTEGEMARHFADRPCDALELLGGFGPDEIEANYLMIARYQDELATGGKPMPLVGASDTHTLDEGGLFGAYSTIVFSPSNDPADLVDAIRSGHCVAVESFSGQKPRIFGPFRLVKLAYFALRELFPEHDALCVEEGRLMLEFAAGNPDARDALAALSGRTAALRDRWYA